MTLTWSKCLIILYCIICVVPVVKNLKEVKLGYLVGWTGSFSFPGRNYAGAITKAIDDINNDPNILNGTTLKFSWRDSGCSYTDGIGAAVDLYIEGVAAFIGPACTRACLAAGYLSTSKKIPMISYSCSTIELSNKKLYPYFARTKPFARSSVDWTPKSIVTLLQKFNWKNVCAVRKMDPIYLQLGTAIEMELKRNNITMLHHELYYEQDSTFKRRGEIMSTMKDKCRIFILIANSGDVTDLMVHAYHMGLTKSPGYAFISVDYFLSRGAKSLQNWNKYLGTEYTNSEFHRTIAEGMISVKVQRANQSSSEIVQFAEDILKRVQEDPFNDTIILKTNKTDLNFAAYLYDATMLYARTIDRMLRNGTDIYNADLVVPELKKTTFEGLTGHVHLDHNGDRIPTFELVNIRNGSFAKAISFDADDGGRVLTYDEFHFPGGTKEAPRDIPKCGFHGEKCPNIEEIERRNLILLVTLAPVLLILVVGFLIRTYRPKLVTCSCI